MPFNNITPPRANATGSTRSSFPPISPIHSNDTSTATPLTPNGPKTRESEGSSHVSALLHQLRQLELENQRIKKDSERYKRERDEARNQVVNITTQASSFTSSFQSQTSPAMSSQQLAQDSDASPSIVSVTSRTISQPSSAQTSPLQSHSHSNAMMYAGLSGDVWGGQGQQPSLNTAFTKFFANLQNWADRYATTKICSLAKGYDTKSILHYFRNLCNDNNVDRLLNSPLRSIIIAALMSHMFSVAYVDKILEKFACPEDQELYMLRSHLEGNIHAKERHRLLVRRSFVLSQVVESEHFSKYLENQASKITGMIHEVLSPMLDHAKREEAFVTLHQLTKECHKISVRMLLMPSEWSISHARPGERWEPHAMVQCDQRLSGEPRLHVQNGSAFKILLGVAPSITEREHSHGSLILFEHHQKRVLLRENMNQPSSNSSPIAPVGAHRNTGR